MQTNIFSEILAWSKQLAPWQNEVIRKLFTNGKLSDADRNAIFELAQIEYGLLPPPPEAVDLMLKPTDLPPPPQADKKILLRGICNVTNANALKSDANLAIGDQLTIIYGDNGSGKSGYARIMKAAFRARAIDPILPNVYTTQTKDRATAIFKIEENGAIRDEKWTDGTHSPQCLGRFAVFDSKCARVYISENNQLGFLPYGFDIIDGLGAITSEVKRKFQELATTSTPKLDVLKPLIDQTTIGKFIGALTANSSDKEAKEKAIWTEADAKSLTEKENALVKLRANAPNALRDGLTGRKRQITTVRDLVKGVADAITDTKVSELKAAITQLTKLKSAVEAAAEAAFGNLDLPGVGGDVWREMLLAAEKYSTTVAFPSQPFPFSGTGAMCVLCQQPLGTEAQGRLTRFWSFIQDDLSSQRDEAEKALALEVEKLSELPHQLPKEIEMLEETLRANGSLMFDKASQFYTASTLRIQAIEGAITNGSWEALPPAPPSLEITSQPEIAAIDKEIESIVDDEKINQSITTFASEIAELNARKKLTDNLSSVLDYLTALKKAAKATTAYSKIATNGISLKASDLQEKFVTGAFRKKVQEELAPINLIRVKAGIDQKSEKGKVLHKLTIDGAPNAAPELVFSEGERSALSLSCFLAELSASDDNCGIIFDDPVSSFDHRVRGAIVNRLVKEAGARQVIILTHDLVFYRELISAAERNKIQITFQHVEALGSVTGILTDTPPWSVTKVGARVTCLEQLLKKAKDAETAANVSDYKSTFRDFYSRLRSTWERAVEELLFNQVVQRYEKEVRTLSLVSVHVDNESIEDVFKGMTQSSAMIEAHDHAAAENASLPPAATLERDLNDLKNFITKQKAKNSAAEKANAHLKK